MKYIEQYSAQLQFILSGNALFGLQGMRANVWETRVLVLQMAVKIQLSHSLIDPQVKTNINFNSDS